MRRSRAGVAIALITASIAGIGLVGAAPPGCAAVRAPNWRPPVGVADPAGSLRVIAIQYKQELRHVETYDAYRTKMRCLVEEFALPAADLDRDGSLDKPTIVVFNEDAGLASLGTGTRGVGARAVATSPLRDPENIPGALAAFGTLGVTYAPAIASYAAQEPETSPQRLIMAAATDVFVRGFMTVFSDIARDYGMYVVASNNQAEFRAVDLRAHPEAAVYLDPDLVPAYLAGTLTTVYEAVDDDGVPESIGAGRAGIDVHNQAFMWAPVEGITSYADARYATLNGGPLAVDDPRANLIHVVKKTPLTQIERDILDLSDDEDLSPANTGPFCLTEADDPGCSAKIGYGISLPTFMWGEAICDDGDQGCVDGRRPVEFDEEPLSTSDPCAEGPVWWMRCLDHRGVNVLLQPEANPGPWGGFTTGRESRGSGVWQPLSWLDSAWRAVADDTVGFRYAVTPHMVGNLVDLVFDGQSVIFERCLAAGDDDTCDGNVPRSFVGASAYVPCAPGEAGTCDPPAWEPYAGPKREVMALAPWVLEDDPTLDPRANRARLAERARALLANSGSVYENDYLETAVWADLDLTTP